MNIKNQFLFFLLTGSYLCGQIDSNPFTTANGPNAPQVGDIIPEEITFAMSTTPAIEFLGASSSFLVPDLENRSYSDFPNEVVVTVYHTPW